MRRISKSESKMRGKCARTVTCSGSLWRVFSVRTKPQSLDYIHSSQLKRQVLLNKIICYLIRQHLLSNISNKKLSNWVGYRECALKRDSLCLWSFCGVNQPSYITRRFTASYRTAEKTITHTLKTNSNCTSAKQNTTSCHKRNRRHTAARPSALNWGIFHAHYWGYCCF